MASIFAYFFDGSNVPQDTLTVSYTLDEINSSGAFVANVATGTMTKTANAGEYLLVYTRDTSKYYVARIDGSATATNRYQGTIINPASASGGGLTPQQVSDAVWGAKYLDYRQSGTMGVIQVRETPMFVGNYDAAFEKQDKKTKELTDTIVKKLEKVSKKVDELDVTPIIDPIDTKVIENAVQNALTRYQMQEEAKKEKQIEKKLLKFIDDTEQEVNIMKIMDDIDTEKRLLEFISQYS